MVKFAVLGCGRIGRMHAINLARHPRAELAWVFDVAGSAAASVAEATGARQARDADEILAAKDVDAVLIASSTNTHLDLLERAVEAGKAVLCEKPIDLDLAKVDACWERIKDRNATIMTGFNRRFDPSFRALRDRLQAGRDRQARAARDHQPRPGPAADRLHRGLGRPVSRHDHPRLRHGPLPDGRDRLGLRRSAPTWSSRRSRRAGDIDAAMIILESAERRALPHQQQPPLHLRLRPADRGVRRARHAPGRATSGRPASRPGAPRRPRQRPRARLLHRALHARLPRRDQPFCRLLSSSGARRSPATATAARRCAWPMPRSRA